MQERIRNKVWVYWFITDVLLIGWAFGWQDGLTHDTFEGVLEY